MAHHLPHVLTAYADLPIFEADDVLSLFHAQYGIRRELDEESLAVHTVPSCAAHQQLPPTLQTRPNSRRCSARPVAMKAAPRTMAELKLRFVT